MANLSVLTFLAQRMQLAPNQAPALPAVVEVAAQKTGLSQAELIQAAWDDARVRDYLAGICAQTDVQAAMPRRQAGDPTH